MYRQEYRNQYGYSVDFVGEHDLFGENRHFWFKGKKSGNKMAIVGDGQLNITTHDKDPVESEKDLADQFIAAEQMKKGEIRMEMNFTPLLAHRYLQR